MRHGASVISRQSSLWCKVLGVLLLVTGITGCQREVMQHERIPLPAAQPEPYVLHLPGIGGYLPVDRNLMRGLREGGVRGIITHYDWTGGNPGLRALYDDANKQKQVDKVVAMLVEVHRVDPQRPIYLIGHSGGAGIAVWALERLPPEVQVQRLILLAPALSRGYNLERALQRVKERAYVFVSQHDPVLAATRVTGTIDGVRVESAGRVGFDLPPDPPEGYDKLVQIPYQDAWMELGHIGDHIGMMEPAFAAAVLAPLITESVETSLLHIDRGVQLPVVLPADAREQR